MASKENYQLARLEIPSINFILQSISDRLDAIEGIRGLPKIQSDLDMDGNRIINVDFPTNGMDGVNLETIQGLIYLTPYSISANRTTVGLELIEATAALTITLNASPANHERVVVYQNAGNGNNVNVTDGTGTDVLNTDQMVVSYYYDSALAQWIRGG